MPLFLDHPVAVLCACTTTLLISVLAVKLATYEAKTGRSRNPLESDPRHRRHQRVSTCDTVEAGTGRSDAFDVIAAVAREVREATAPSSDDTIDDHDAVARTILPAAARLRRPIRSRDFTPDQRRVVSRFRRLIQQYAVEHGGWSTAGERDDLRETLHQTACTLHSTYSANTTAVPAESEEALQE